MEIWTPFLPKEYPFNIIQGALMSVRWSRGHPGRDHSHKDRKDFAVTFQSKGSQNNASTEPLVFLLSCDTAKKKN